MARVKCALCLKPAPEKSVPSEAVAAAFSVGYTSVRFPYEEDPRRTCSPFFCLYCGTHLRNQLGPPAKAVLVPLAEDAAFENDTDY